MPATASARMQLAAVVLLSSATFAFGFLSSLPPAGESAAEAMTELSHGATSATPVHGDAGEAGDEQDEARSAVFSCVLQFPFESVLQAWEGGAPDPNFIKEEVIVETSGSEEHRMKTLYTKNPLPYIIRKTVRVMLPALCAASAAACVRHGCAQMRGADRRALTLGAADSRRDVYFRRGPADQQRGAVLRLELQ